MTQETATGATPAPFFAVVHGGERLAPLRVVATHLLERSGLEVLVAASRDEAIARARDPSCVLLLDLSGEPAPLAEALKGHATPVLIAATDHPGGENGTILLEPAGLVTRLRPIVHHAREAAVALGRMRALSKPSAERTAPTAADLGLRPTCARTDELARTIAALALDAQPVVIHGPAGSGKKHMARLLHALSVRREGPLVVLDASSVTPETAAQAHGGTLVLEGSERLAAGFGPALATLVAERRLGDRIVDARVVLLARDDPLAPFTAAAPRAVLEASHVIRLPALGERPEEAIALVDELLAAEGERRGQRLELSFAALEHILAYPWPGGIRELQAACEHAARAADGGDAGVTDHGVRTVEPEHLPSPVQRALARPSRGGPTLASVVDAVERALIARSIQQHRGRLEEVSRSLGVAPRTLRRKILQHGLREETAALRRSA